MAYSKNSSAGVKHFEAGLEGQDVDILLPGQTVTTRETLGFHKTVQQEITRILQRHQIMHEDPRQYFMAIDLTNGKSITMEPGMKVSHYKDQLQVGNTVKLVLRDPGSANPN